MMLSYIVIFLSFGTAILLSSLNWRRSIYAILIIIVIEGILRKWVLPQASDLIIFLKDIILIGAYFKYYVLDRHNQSNSQSILWLPILLFSIWCLAETFNPYLGSPIAGLFGAKAYLLYIPLINLVSNLFKSETELLNFVRYYLVLVIPVGLLGVVQFFSLASSPVNVYAGGTDIAAAFGGEFQNVRITGTFSYLSGYSAYATVCFTLLLPLLMQYQTRFWVLITLIEFSILFITSFMTGARALVLYMLLFSAGYIVVMILKRDYMFLRYGLRFVIIALLILAMMSYTRLGTAMDAFRMRATTSDSVTERVYKEFLDLSTMYESGQFAGYGTGATHQALSALRQTLDLPSGNLVFVFSEGELGRILLELGPVGMLLWYGLRISLLFAMLRVACSLRSPRLYCLAFAIFLFSAINLIWPLVFNHVFATYYWFLNGFIFLLPKLDQATHLNKTQRLVLNNVTLVRIIHSSYGKYKFG